MLVETKYKGWFEEPVLSYGDYLNTGTVGKSNFMLLQKMFDTHKVKYKFIAEDNIEEFFEDDRIVKNIYGAITWYGMYNTQGWYLNKDYLEKNFPNIWEKIVDLEKYPCFDDEQLSELEWEISVCDWDSFGKDEIYKAITIVTGNNDFLWDDEIQLKAFQWYEENGYIAMENLSAYFHNDDYIIKKLIEDLSISV